MSSVRSGEGRIYVFFSFFPKREIVHTFYIGHAERTHEQSKAECICSNSAFLSW